MGDNIDKNIRPSLQRFDNKTNSLHYFHYYAILDRLDLSACSEIVSTDIIDLKDRLVGMSDMTQSVLQVHVFQGKCTYIAL